MTTATGVSPYRIPVTEEIEAFDLPVEGALPPELRGDYIRNGPNPPPGAKPQHLFLGDGMLHGVRIEGGRARAYRNRWVRTRSFVEHAKYVRMNGTIDLSVGVANTNVVAHGKRLMALVESSFPTLVTRELATQGPFDFDGRLTTPFTAHPKICPRTGEMHAFGMSFRPGALTYHRIDAGGTLIESRPIPVKGVTMMHDFALTQTHAIFMDLPVRFDFMRAIRGTMPYHWDAKYGARLGIVKRDDPSVPVRWIEIDPCYVFHVANAYDEGDNIVIDVAYYEELWRKDAGAFDPTTLRRWTIDMRAGSVSRTMLDDRSVEFPRIDERLTGSAHRYVYAVGAGATGDGRSAVYKFDVVNGTSSAHDFGAGCVPGEAVFVPAGDGEDAGYLMCYVYDGTREGSDFVVLDAGEVTAGPIARVRLPARVPLGFHGNWISDDANVD
jgi:carotenoid cleavage dioxygenase-like enzyme